ncbi:hypothetical protein SmJEL517_g03011 [Synchytrium microbalum]|uniref:CCDC113/CCDC96 coiled-coil domain-containing protein n=1 Tax=Synchytrium microbalum TaxID=1806994 RepID=A0A507BYC0_9FUNG|nr:uncharacterized protein SmJEL517_g03011 [Synchytrium microbalum]TPX34310.1 hypothetical protein SmJEL517_g03011 [Synchytrium microbalum]
MADSEAVPVQSTNADASSQPTQEIPATLSDPKPQSTKGSRSSLTTKVKKDGTKSNSSSRIDLASTKFTSNLSKSKDKVGSKSRNGSTNKLASSRSTSMNKLAPKSKSGSKASKLDLSVDATSTEPEPSQPTSAVDHIAEATYIPLAKEEEESVERPDTLRMAKSITDLLALDGLEPEDVVDDVESDEPIHNGGEDGEADPEYEPSSAKVLQDIMNSPVPTNTLPIDAVTFTHADPSADPEDMFGGTLSLGPSALSQSALDDDEFENTQEEDMIPPSTPTIYAEKNEDADDSDDGDDMNQEPDPADLQDRDELIEGIREALETREKLRHVNFGLQAKLAEYFRRKRAEEVRETDKSGTDQEQRYNQCVTSISDLTEKRETHSIAHAKTVTDLSARLSTLKTESDSKSTEFTSYKRRIAKESENSRTGQPIPFKAIDSIEILESRKDAEVSAVQLEHIRLKNRLKRCELALKQREELADGLHLIDFEQLKIENQAYNEKIEERNEELLKLRKKITTVVQILTHVREKLQFVQTENEVLKKQMLAIDAQVSDGRDALPAAKRKRDSLKAAGLDLKTRNGLLGSKDLLRDHESKVDATEKISFKLEMLKSHHESLRAEQQKLKRDIAKTQILQQAVKAPA